MSTPFTNECIYCGSPNVLDDAWWCDSRVCGEIYNLECKEEAKYEKRTPLTRKKAIVDLMDTGAFVWGPSAIAIEDAAGAIARLAKAPVRLTN